MGQGWVSRELRDKGGFGKGLGGRWGRRGVGPQRKEGCGGRPAAQVRGRGGRWLLVEVRNREMELELFGG